VGWWLKTLRLCLITDFENETQSAANTIHIQPNQQMTFDLQYKETLEDMLQFSDKIQSKARVVFDIYGSTVNDMFGEIYSPNYPSNYPDNADITWWIRVPYDKVIRVNIVDLDIEACCDRLVVYDGDSLDGQSLAILTGSIAKLTQTVFQSTRNEIIIHLSSDCSKAKSGFKATVKAVPTEQSVDNSTTCAGSTYFNHSSGSIQSPNYPSAYNPNADCSWTIQIPVEKYVVKLTLVDFHLETNYDFLYIHDGLSSNSSLIAALTGHQTGKSFLSTSTVMFLQFTSDSVGNWQGFSVNFTSAYVATNDQPTAPPNNGTACDGVEYIETILGSDMYITSPGYSSYYYGNNLFCSWLIYSQTKVHVSDIYVDLYYDGDYLAFFDGSSSSSPLLKNYTGNSYPSNFESSGPYLFVQFVTDSSGTDNGFRFDASMDVNSTSLTAYGSSDYFQSRNYPNSYYNNAYSTWTITSYYSSYYVRSQITYYDVESCCDYLHFFDGSKNTDPELSHSGLNSYVSSSGRYLFVTFTSDSSVTKTGFQVRYYYVY